MLKKKAMRRNNANLVTWACGIFVGYIVLRATGLLDGFSTFKAGSTGMVIRATGEEARMAQSFPMTTFKAHAPGFSVIDNLYWYNRTYIIVTDQPWHVPELRLIASLSTNTNAPKHGRVAVKLIGIRNPSVAPSSTDESKQLGETISLQSAMYQYGSAEVIEGPAIINNDDNFINHYYHWIGETFLGSWRVWNNYAWRSGNPLPQIKRVGFPQQYSHADKPEGHDGKVWEDKPGANVWFTKKFFPGVIFESKGVWDQRAESLKVYRITTAILADRAGGHSGPSASWKPWGDALRLPVSPDWLVNLRNRVLAGYRGPVSLKKPKLPVVTYLARQSSGRRLLPADHDALWTALQTFQAEGLAEVNIEDFNSSTPFDTQVATIARSNILVAVHGNGLTHSLWMDPGPKQAVFEMQPAICTVTDYSPLAIAAGVKHYMVHEDSFCVPETCPPRGCEVSGGINSDSIRVTPSVVTNEIRRLLAQ